MDRKMFEDCNAGDYRTKQEEHLAAISRQADSMLARQTERQNRVLLRLGLRGEDQPLYASVESIWDCRSSLSGRPNSRTPEEVRRVDTPMEPPWTPGHAISPVVPAPCPVVPAPCPVVPPPCPVVPAPRPPQNFTPLVKSSCRASRIPTIKRRGGEVKQVAGCRLLTTKQQLDTVEESAQRLQNPQYIPPQVPEQRGLKHSGTEDQGFRHSVIDDQKSRHCENIHCDSKDGGDNQCDGPVYVPTPAKGPPPMIHKDEQKPESEPDDATRRQQETQALLRSKAFVKPYEEPIDKLEEFFQLMPMEDWMKKISALDIVQRLIAKHLWIVKRDLHKICTTLTDEISNSNSSVSCGVVDSLAMLLLHFEDLMDPEAETITLALMQRLGLCEEEFVKERINLALDILVQNCNFSPVITALLNCGHGHRSAAVRSSTVVHLGQVIELIGVGNLFSNNKHLDERVIVSVSYMALDVEPEVRDEGQRLLKLLANYWDFPRIFENNLPGKAKVALREILEDDIFETWEPVETPFHEPAPLKHRLQIQYPNCETWATVSHGVPVYVPTPPEGPPPKNRKARRGLKKKNHMQAPESETCAPVPDEAPVYVPTPPKEPPPKDRTARPGLKQKPQIQATVADEAPVYVPTPPKGPPPKNQKAGQKKNPGSDDTAKRQKAIQALMEIKAKAFRYEEPTKKLDEFFLFMPLYDWEKKMEALDIIQTLIVKHPKIVKKELHKICVTLTDEILHLRHAVSCGVVDSLSMLFLHYKELMDPETEVITLGLMQRLGLGKEKFIKEKTNLALDLVVQNCDYGRVVTALLNCGHGQRSVSVRASTAVHLGQVIDSIGMDNLFANHRYLDERVIVAVSQMALDAVPEVRQEGRRLLKLLVDYWDFPRIFEDKLPIKDKLPLGKILRKPK